MAQTRPLVRRLSCLSGLSAYLYTTWQHSSGSKWLAVTWCEQGLWAGGMGRIFHTHLWSNGHHHLHMEGTWCSYERCKRVALPICGSAPGRCSMDFALANSVAILRKDDK